MKDNPYAVPDSSEYATSTPGGLNHARKFARLLNGLVDGIVVFIVAIGLVIIPELGPQLSPEQEERLTHRSLMVGLLAVILHYIVFEAVFGRTIGKMLTATRVVAADGSKPSIYQIVGRTLARFIPFEAVSFLTNRPGGWHDRLSGTAVIQE